MCWRRATHSRSEFRTYRNLGCFCKVSHFCEEGPSQIVHKRERSLAMHLVRFPEAVEEMLADLAPNRITEYVYQASELFSQFYADCQARSILSY